MHLLEDLLSKWMTLPFQVLHDFFNRVGPEAPVNQLLVLKQGPHDVVRVDMASVKLKIFVHVIVLVECEGFVVEVAQLVALVLLCIEFLEDLLVLKISIGDNVWLAVPRVKEWLTVLVDLRPSSELVNVFVVVLELLQQPELRVLLSKISPWPFTMLAT